VTLIRDALAQTERRLAEAGVDTPRVDAEWLVAHVLGVPRTRIYEQDEVDAAALEPLVARRETREPLPYVLGEWGFRRLTLKTDRRALVPRPETEVVVERALALIADLAEPRVLDVGVGSGPIALAIADEHPKAHVTGIDSSGEALELACENAESLGLDVQLRRGGVEAAAEGWDLVVANPPYIPRDELASLQPEVRWEPYDALADTGLHEAIVRTANTTWIVLEVGDDQARSVERSLAAHGYTEARITRDLAGAERVVEGRRAERG
jgi:release factor glutamine methyltransferase